MNTYEEVVELLFSQAPSFQVVGSKAYHPGLQKTQKFNELAGRKDLNFKSIHIAGTNGKGSTSSMLAAMLSGMGYRVGLFTSPHLQDFRERIKIIEAGRCELVKEEFVVEFYKKYEKFIKKNQPSFFEICTIMAFDAFASAQVDYAIIETGLGGRLDSTNVIDPIMTVITSIGLDHCDILGSTLEEVAKEKAGIIKKTRPCILGDIALELHPIFQEICAQMESPLIHSANNEQIDIILEQSEFDASQMDLRGDYQRYNVRTALTVINELFKKGEFVKWNSVPQWDNIIASLYRASVATGLRGRWEELSQMPKIICDIAHNPQGMESAMSQLQREYESKKEFFPDARLYILIGMVSDKDVEKISSFLPEDAYYYFTNAEGSRALPASSLEIIIKKDKNLEGEVLLPVKDAFNQAKQKLKPQDILYVGGSSFVVAEALICI